MSCDYSILVPHFHLISNIGSFIVQIVVVINICSRLPSVLLPMSNCPLACHNYSLMFTQ